MSPDPGTIEHMYDSLGAGATGWDHVDPGPGLDETDWNLLDAGHAPANVPTGADLAMALDSSCMPGLALAVLLSARPTAGAHHHEVLDHIRGWTRHANHVHAMLLAQIAELCSRRDDHPLELLDQHEGEHEPLLEFVSGEIAAALHITTAAADDLVEQAQQLHTRLGATWDALAAGAISPAAVRVIIAETVTVHEDHLAAVEAAALGRATTATPTQLRAFIRRTAIGLDPATARRREQAAIAGRRVGRGPTYDGVGHLYAVLPAADLDAVWATLDTHARNLPTHPDDTRTLDEKRADTLITLITAPHTLEPLPTPVRYSDVTVAATTLAGHDNHPAHLGGYGPITAQTARQLAPTTTWRRLNTDKHDHATTRSTTTHPPTSAIEQTSSATEQTSSATEQTSTTDPASTTDRDNDVCSRTSPATPTPTPPAASPDPASPERRGPASRGHHGLRRRRPPAQRQRQRQ